jgi:hypothetical protein
MEACLQGVGRMSLITPEYLAQQQELHRNPDYGTSSSVWAPKVLDLLSRESLSSVLDYGCGKGHLKNELGEIVAEYDPAIEGKDADPEPADLVVCSDVLEHIEPECLDQVLEHIRSRTKHWNLFVIATRPAIKTLPDGRNAHLIIQNADWWHKRLSAFFDVKESDATNAGEYVVVAKPYLLLGEIKGKGAVADEIRNEQMRTNVGLVSKRLKVRNPLEPHNRVAIILCYGPSLEETWQTAILEKQALDAEKGADLVSVSGAHDYLIARGVVPKYHIECDPRKHKGDMLTKPHRNTEYLMASCVHPDVIGKLVARKRKVRLWHLNNGDGSLAAAMEADKNAVLIGGGGSVGLRAIPVLMAMGYRRFIVHGMDCSHRGDASHAGHHTGKKTDRIEVRCHSCHRHFITSPVLVTYQRNFDDLRQYIGDPSKDPTKIEIILRGDGLLQHTLICGGAAEAGPMHENKEDAA